MKCLQIIVDKEKYSESQIIAIGKEKNGRTLLPQIIFPKNFDKEKYLIWEKIISVISSIDPNGWRAVQVLATKEEKIEMISNDESKIVPYISLTILRIWDDGTTDKEIILNFTDKDLISLWDYLIG